MKISKGLVAASSSPLILSILSESESYGYAIIQRVRDLSGGEMEWTEGMLYPVLHWLEKNRYVSAHWVVGETGRKRRYYAISAAGRKYLSEQRRQWEIVSSTLRKAGQLS